MMKKSSDMVDRQPQLMLIDEVAEICRVSPATVYRWLDRGILPDVRIGNSRRVKRRDLDALIDGDELK